MKENVLGIRHEGVARAYSVTRMRELGPRLAINDDMNGLAVLVAFHTASALAIPFDRRVGATEEAREVIAFDIAKGEGFPFKLRDRQTGSIWNLNGVAISGPLEGERRKKIPTFTALWFAWSAFNVDSEIHGGNE